MHVILQVAIALKGAVYLWNASTGSIETVRSISKPLHAAAIHHVMLFCICTRIPAPTFPKFLHGPALM